MKSMYKKFVNSKLPSWPKPSPNFKSCLIKNSSAHNLYTMNDFGHKSNTDWTKFPVTPTDHMLVKYNFALTRK